jgi:signal recognition particle receptor subunit alpha
MQDNEPLMKALSRLVHINKPDLVIFIGEALVGNDGIDQLSKFNSALRDLSSGLISMGDRSMTKYTKGREIDGVILSKFDTVDDKVGAALSMTYATGKPILFVGVGQKYPHLKKLNIDQVINSLLS